MQGDMFSTGCLNSSNCLSVLRLSPIWCVPFIMGRGVISSINFAKTEFVYSYLCLLLLWDGRVGSLIFQA